jgi:predicted polyphosphate/ATP-dependent NAD kinase
MEAMRAFPRKLGLIVNPIAGLGGAVALKGTDGLIERALRLGAQPHAALRTARALRVLRGARRSPSPEILVGGAAMGEHVARMVGFKAVVLASPASTSATYPEDTQRAAFAMMEAGIELLLFAGGDGTARDIFKVVGDRVPMLGIPAGVKMHSAVFATSAAHAGEVARRYVYAADAVSLAGAEIMGRQVTNGRDSPLLFGLARTPRAPLLTQYAKAILHCDDATVLRGACQRAADIARTEALTIIGPGSTTSAVKQMLGFGGTLDGVDLVSKGRALAMDVTEAQIQEALDQLWGTGHAPRVSESARIIVSVVGGQGNLFGRGNQQISAEVIRRVGRDNVTVIASRSKLASLPDQCLFVDTGVAEVDALLAGHIPVWTGARERMIYRVEGGQRCGPVP